MEFHQTDYSFFFKIDILLSIFDMDVNYVLWKGIEPSFLGRKPSVLSHYTTRAYWVICISTFSFYNCQFSTINRGLMSKLGIKKAPRIRDAFEFILQNKNSYSECWNTLSACSCSSRLKFSAVKSIVVQVIFSLFIVKL